MSFKTIANDPNAALLRSFRNDFPALSYPMNAKRLAYLDTASSAQKPKSVIAAMDRVMQTGYSNIHRGLYKISQDLTAEFEDVRQSVADFIGASASREIIFTRNTTEAINLVAQSWGRTYLKAGDEIILSAMEHHANIVSWQILRDQIGIVIKIIPLNAQGGLDVGAFQKLLTAKTKFVGVVHISNALGTINPVEDIIRMTRAHDPEIKILIDGSQSVVHAKVNVQALDCDFFTFTGHKLYGPTGIGVLYGRYDILEHMPPYQGGGDMIERVTFEASTFKLPPARFEAGTPAIVQVIGLGAAMDYMNKMGMDTIAAREAQLNTIMLDGLKTIKGMKIFGPETARTGIASFTIEGLNISDVASVLDQCGVAVRAGHHCCMPLMQALGVEGTLRASLGVYSTIDDVNQLIAGLNKAQEMLA
jgi:cysteine desulfurase/selenocysteine lyase